MDQFLFVDSCFGFATIDFKIPQVTEYTTRKAIKGTPKRITNIMIIEAFSSSPAILSETAARATMLLRYKGPVIRITNRDKTKLKNLTINSLNHIDLPFPTNPVHV